MASSREAACAALFSLVSDAYAWGSTPSRRLKLWTDSPKTGWPALFQYEGGDERYVYSSNGQLYQRVLVVKLFVYTDAGAATDPSIIPTQQQNAILDAIDATLAPQGADLYGSGFQSLGDTVYSAKITGVLKTPGDIDGDGLAVVSVELVMP